MTHAAVAYGRKSFDDPDERTSSVDDQQLFAQGYAERCGLEIIAFHGDDGITGATMERPGLQQVLKLITSGKVRNLIIEDVDRLSRDAEHLHYMVKLFRLHRVAVHTVVAGKVEASLLVKLIERRAKPFMPPKDNRGPRPSEIAVLKAWIAGGAKPFPSLDGPPSLTVPSVPTRGPVRQPVNAVVVSPDGSWYAAARTGRVELIGLPADPKAKPLATLAGLPGQVSDLALSSDGRHLVTAAGPQGRVLRRRLAGAARHLLGRPMNRARESPMRGSRALSSRAVWADATAC